MKNILLITLFFILIYPRALKAQVRNVIVETYYISDANDATDTIDGSGRILPVGSKTYRVYVQLDQGYKLKKIYGDVNHTLKIMSTDTFFNNIDRPSAYFGYLVNKVWFPANPTLALDSWLTLGHGAKNYTGTLKADDTDGSLIGGTHNYGGTAMIPGGLLVNNDTDAGIPVTTADGLIPLVMNTVNWSDVGFRDQVSGGIDTTVFGSVNTGTSFVTNSAYLEQSYGEAGNPVNNNVLVAQLTTRGDISFELNVAVLDASGNETKFVADGNILLADEQISPFLKYPSVCGCTDPEFLEFSPNYSCSVHDSCRTRIVYGCMDPMSCNYDPNANFNIPELCCYPGHCNDRDISVVCPQLTSEFFRLYPNPAQNEIALEFSSADEKGARYEIYNSFGRRISEKNLNTDSGRFNIDISELHSGLYMFLLYRGNTSESKTFLKN